MTAWVFIPAIIPSIAAGSDKGFGGGDSVLLSLELDLPLESLSLSFRNSPEENAVRRELERVL